MHLNMDLVLCHQCNATCIMALNYDEFVRSGIELHQNGEGRISLLAIMFNHGPKLQAVKESLIDLPLNKRGWYLASPGEVLDRVHSICCPGSITNTHSKALDKVLAVIPVDSAKAPRVRNRHPVKKQTTEANDSTDE
jgi:hypothetical protein